MIFFSFEPVGKNMRRIKVATVLSFTVTYERIFDDKVNTVIIMKI